ncbi:hypothetical protein MHBO_002998 [Bonamia ostreae]|uniref:Uncharacterized protein n=1 Tax=Bonamia ostreae TaxID=126728 RepID=A0ABV2AP59_9EUKA
MFLSDLAVSFIKGICYVFSYIEEEKNLRGAIRSVMSTCLNIMRKMPATEDAVVTGIDGIAHIVQCFDIRHKPLSFIFFETTE